MVAFGQSSRLKTVNLYVEQFIHNDVEGEITFVASGWFPLCNNKPTHGKPTHGGCPRRYS